MRVLVVGPDRKDPGGVANYYNAVFPKLSDDTVTACYLEIGSTHGKGNVLHAVHDQVRFWRTIGKFKPDIVHLNPSLDLRSFLRDGLFIFLAKMRSRSVLVFFRGWQEPFEKKVYGRYRWFFQTTYARADGFVVLAKKFARCLHEWGIAVPVHIGTTAVADELLEGFSIKNKASNLLETEVIRLLYLARLERDKGVLELIDAVKHLLKRGVPLSLTVAGEGPMMSQVRQQVKTFDRHGDKVRILGYVRGQKKIEILRSHHVYCFPTQYGEGMPNSVLEAMAFGMPIVTCPVGGIVDFFENNKMGVLLDSSDPEYLADSIESLILNREQLKIIMRYNYNYAQTRFLASTAAEMLRTCYRNMYDSEY